MNYGYPLNTTDDDVFLITTADGKRAFFSSDKPGGSGEKDIYMIKFPEYEPRDITILLGHIVNNTTESISNNKIYIINSVKGDTIQALSANSSTGKYGANLPIGASYKTVFTVNGKEIYSEVLDAPKGHGYQVIRKDVPYNGDVHTTAVDSAELKALAAHNKLCDPRASFQLFFKYNKKEIDTKSAEFITFVDGITSCLKADPSFAIDIESSASTVPTRTFRSNENLANLRAKNAREKIIKELTKKGFKESQITFSSPKTLVQGPEYKKDALENSAVYEQYQYIKIKAGKKK